MQTCLTYVMQVEAFWVVACNAFEESVAVLGRAKACLHLLACSDKAIVHEVLLPHAYSNSASSAKCTS